MHLPRELNGPSLVDVAQRLPLGGTDGHLGPFHGTTERYFILGVCRVSLQPSWASCRLVSKRASGGLSSHSNEESREVAFKSPRASHLSCLHTNDFSIQRITSGAS